MKREEHLLGEIYAYRYQGKNPKYALVVSHGIASHGGIYDKFCVHHAERGADIWSFDAPGHGKSTTNRPRGQWTMEEWADASVAYAEHVKAKTGLPVFVLGSSLGIAAAFSSLHSDAITGAILMGSPAVPSTPLLAAMGEPWRNEAVGQVLGMVGRAARMDCSILFNFDEDYGYAGAGEQKRADPWNTWTYDLASWRTLYTYEPPIPADKNEKPILFACGGKDASFPRELLKGVADSIAGPVEFYCMEEGTHQLMLFHTAEFSEKVDQWVNAQI